MAGSQAMTWRGAVRVRPNRLAERRLRPTTGAFRRRDAHEQGRSEPGGATDQASVTPHCHLFPASRDRAILKRDFECSRGWTAPSVRIQPRARCRISGQESPKRSSALPRSRLAATTLGQAGRTSVKAKANPWGDSGVSEAAWPDLQTIPDTRQGLTVAGAGLPTEPATFSWRGGWRRPRSSSHSGH